MKAVTEVVSCDIFINYDFTLNCLRLEWLNGLIVGNSVLLLGCDIQIDIGIIKSCQSNNKFLSCSVYA